ncbi:DUF1223 domain-containing protein [Acidimangrovimonas sediminis]|uniref:DUF1223 domain-containing protein n=1 Tax=Acidimangrovimonas sediminis TaxID=2056283 RepID=UPI000C810854|nr:DUF1223 domain-containing protein [Acidimangrovimonas sediminis]
MRGISGAAICLWLAFSGAALADQAAAPARTVVVELYTSQGCSSCPPADELLGQIARHDGVIALGFHVDYWDYIGWKDEFGSADWTLRQKNYARAAGNRTIYTPQMIVEGETRVVGYKPMELATLIHKTGAQPAPATLTLSRKGATLTIRATAAKPFDKPADVQLVRYIPERRVAIRRGENAGRTMDYHNIVTALDVLGTWDGAQPFEAEVKLSGDQPGAVLIQAPGPGEIYAAARVSAE